MFLFEACSCDINLDWMEERLRGEHFYIKEQRVILAIYIYFLFMVDPASPMQLRCYSKSLASLVIVNDK